MTCSVCFRPAAVLVYGKYRNGREVRDPRCQTHAPALGRDGSVVIGPVLDRQWAFVGVTNRLFVMEDIDIIRPGLRAEA